MTRRPTLLRETLARHPSTAEAVAAGFILPADHSIGGRPVYSSTAWTEEVTAAGESDWSGAALLLAAGASQHRPIAGRMRVAWRIGGVAIPTTVTIQPRRGIVLVALDGE